jgi:hypothetical protein
VQATHSSHLKAVKASYTFNTGAMAASTALLNHLFMEQARDEQIQRNKKMLEALDVHTDAANLTQHVSGSVLPTSTGCIAPLSSSRHYCGEPQ